VWGWDNAPATWRNPRRDRATPWDAAMDALRRRLPWKHNGRLDKERGPIRAAALLLIAAVASPWIVAVTLRELRRGWRAACDLWASPATELPSKRR
jgi:hypothetical protein